MTDSLDAPRLLDRVLEVLNAASGPMSTQEIADKVGPGFHDAVDRLLRGVLQSFVIEDPQGKWTQVRKPSVVSPTSRGAASQRRTSAAGWVAPDEYLRHRVDQKSLDRIQATLDLWKRELIEFGRRNKLLYFNSSRRTRLRLIAPAGPTLYEGLVLREKSFSFAIPAVGSIDQAELEDDDSQAVEAPEQRGDIEVDYETSSAKDVRALQRKLFRLRSDARTVINEQGINTLHLSFGILRWQESDASQNWVESPLVLAPVALGREPTGPYGLSGYEGDVVVNPALAHRLRHDFAIELPSFDPFDGFGEDADVLGYLESVASSVRDRGWQVTSDTWLTHFSFEKLVMYEDLSQPGTAEAAEATDALAAICNVRDVETPEISTETLHEDFELPETFPVVDADSSQIEVIARVRAGQNLVVQGPPGTGKSQTIVNLIAQAIRDGKSVLFVSEKRAALDVVHRRLRDVGLSDLCLELHSHRASKREVVQDLYFGMQGSLDTAQQPAFIEFERRRAARRQLDDYVRALREPRGAARLTAFALHGEAASLASAPWVESDLPVERYLNLGGEAEATLTTAINGIVVTGLRAGAGSHPWRDAVVDQPAFIVTQTVAPQIEKLRGDLAEVLDVNAQYRRWSPSEPGGGSLAIAREFSGELDSLAGAPDVFAPAWLSSDADTFARTGDLIVEARNLAISMRATTDTLRESRALALVADRNDVAGLLARYRGEYRTLKGRISSGYRRDRKHLRASLGRRVPYQEGRDLLSSVRELQEAQIWFEANGEEITAAVGGPWPADDAAEALLLGALEWAGRHRGFLPDGNLPVAAATTIASEIVEIRSWAGVAGGRVASASAEAMDAVAPLAPMFPSGLDGVAIPDVELTQLKQRADGWVASIEKLDEWAEYERAVRRCTSLGLADFLTEAARESVSDGDLTPALRKLIAARRLRETYQDEPVLATFGAKTHEAVIEEFSRLDRALRGAAGQATRYGASVRQAVVRNAAQAQGTNARSLDEATRAARDEFKLVKKEYGKKRMHLPLRRLLPQLPTLLPAIKPCLLMSPLSVAHYLPRDRFKFDLVIFDEASQVLPADAVGAIMRGRQVVVLGDSKQLPPTRFFQRRLDGDDQTDGEDDDDVSDAIAFDSILEICAAALPQTGLRWHYRSRDERLIAFSNRVFYAERPLITFPSPDPAGDTGVRFVYVPDGVYDRGGSKTNIVEARRIVGLVVEHVDRFGWERSLGVIALSLGQRDAIELEMRRRILERPDLGPFLGESGSEPFFIKNLETVQGDERDEVIIGLGYGPSEPGGIPALSFGPLNTGGGERRLNVAVTRAKFGVTLVSSMRPEQLDRTAELTSEGPKVLAQYMRYVARGGHFEPEAILDPARGTDSPFEDAVLAALRSRGYTVDPQVGASGFRIDLGVRHPDQETRYILGVECDGATYHSSLFARDRDRLRQEMLEAQGWKIHRVWSTDWIRHPEQALQAIIDRIEELRAADESGIFIASARTAAVETGDPLPVDHDESAVSPAPSPRSALPHPFVEEQRDSLVFEQSRLERQVRGMHESHAEFSAQPDKGFTSGEVEQALEQRLAQVSDALGRIESGTYGICTNCGQPIQIERLEAVPFTALCRICSQH